MSLHPGCITPSRPRGIHVDIMGVSEVAYPTHIQREQTNGDPNLEKASVKSRTFCDTEAVTQWNTIRTRSTVSFVFVILRFSRICGLLETQVFESCYVTAAISQLKSTAGNLAIQQLQKRSWL